MKVMLEEPHYVDDVLLDKGVVVGDGENVAHDWRYKTDVKHLGIKAGERRPLSHAMSPLDDEAKAALKKAFGTEKPEADPTKAIPIQGTTPDPGLAHAKAPPLLKKA
jgi:hypothetical protein